MLPSVQRTTRALLSLTSLPSSSWTKRQRIVFSTCEGRRRGGGRRRSERGRGVREEEGGEREEKKRSKEEEKRGIEERNSQ